MYDGPYKTDTIWLLQKMETITLFIINRVYDLYASFQVLKIYEMLHECPKSLLMSPAPILS